MKGSLRKRMFVAISVGVLAAVGAMLAPARAVFAQDVGLAQDQDDEVLSNPPAWAEKPAGVVFAMTNKSNANRIVVYARADDGTLLRIRRVRTRGLGIGTDLDSQGGLRLSEDHRFLYAVNAGSDDVTVFRVDGTRLHFLQRVGAGDEPVGLTLSGDLLYVLNGSVAGNGIQGFRIRHNGTLAPIPNSFRALSSRIAVPGNVQFSPDGHVILVTHKTTNELVPPFHIIDGFTVGSDGLASAIPIANESHGIRPFSLAFRADGTVFVVESFNALDNHSAVSSYRQSPDGSLAVLRGSVPNDQTDTCWIVISGDQNFAFTANFGSGTISSYSIDGSGETTLINGEAAFLGDLSQPVDLSLSANGHFLYLLLRGLGAVAAFRVEGGGILVPLGTVVGGLPVNDGASGLASF